MLDLMMPPPPPHVIFRDRPEDEAKARIIASGLARNEYLMSLGSAVLVRPINDWPSRLFRFPTEYVDGEEREDGQTAILLNHPDLAAFPFVDEVEHRCGIRPVWEPKDKFGRDRGERHRYFHAIDMMTDDHWQILLDTINFTDRSAMIGALRYHADYGGISTKNMRSILDFMGLEEPADRSEEFLNSYECRVTECSGGKFVGIWTKDERGVWAAIHGLEAKLFRRDQSGHLRFSKDFLAKKEAV